jgi:hypothetical protein
MKNRPESKLVTEDPENTASRKSEENHAGDNKKRPDSKLVTEDPDPAPGKSETQRETRSKERSDTKVGAGGSPSAGAITGDSKHRDDSKMGSEKLKKEVVRKSEKQNLTQKKGYNETPATHR